MLEISNIESFYGVSQALFGINLKVEAGEVVTLLGRNGMGKTTTLNSLMGIVRPRSGSIVFRGEELTGQPSYKIAQRGLGLVPEGRQIFPNLTVYENLYAAAGNRRGNANPWTLERIYEMFPILEERRSSMGNLLSGGEQQMLAISRALMTNPDLLILDEATEGLAPLIRQEIWACLKRLKDEGQSILVVDKNVADLCVIANRHFIIEKGMVVWEGSSDELKAQPDLQERYLGV
ncbi:MAG: ABC transporter ATP-binding protein [Rhodobiaceae bacterium]|nr:ABC transporter ATP-binding protein [Rhodobiaceae bacterium]